MKGPVNRSRLLLASAMSLVTMALAFSVRSDILSALGLEFDLSHVQQGLILTAAAWGYPFTVLLAAPLCDMLGMGRLFAFAFVAQVAGVLLTLASPALGFSALLVAMFCLSLAEGVIESVINPLAATLYPDDKTGKLNLLHAGWPAGLAVGGLLCLAWSAFFGLDAPGGPGPGVLSLSWKVKFACILAGSAAWGGLMLGQKFPRTERVAAGVSTADMFRDVLRPGFLLLVVCMVFTAMTEMGPAQWIGSVMTDTVGMRGITFLVWIAVIMFAFRLVAGRIVRRFGPFPVLAASCLTVAAGLFWLSHAFTPAPAFMAVTLVAAGTTLLWPILLGITSERFPKSGALGLAILSATGAVSGGLIGPSMGAIYDRYTLRDLPPHISAIVTVDGRYSPVAKEAITAPADRAALREAERQGAAMTFRWVSILPLAPLLIYIPMILWHRSRGGYRPVKLRKR